MDTQKTGLGNSRTAVLLLNLAKYYGGAAVRTVQIAKMLQAEKYLFIVVVLKDSPLHQRLLSEKVPVTAVDYGRGHPGVFFWLRKFIRQNRYSVVDTHNPQSHLWGMLAAKLAGGCRVVTTVHGCYGEAETGWRSKLYDAVLRWNDCTEANFIAVSDSVNCYLRKIGIKHAKITYIPNAVFPNNYTGKSPTMRQLANWDDNTFIISIAARLEPVKGIEYLIKAFAIANKTHPHLRLFILGDGRLRSDLEQLTIILGIQNTVYFAGFRQDVTQILHSADVFCLSSLSEGLPFAVLEAAMASLPLVLSNVGGMAELFTHQKTALLFPVKDVEKLTQYLIKLADNPILCKQLGNQANLLIKERFSAQLMFEQTLQIYQNKRQ